MEYGPVNYLAVLVAAIVGFAPGALWYSQAMFGKSWQQLTGVTDEAGKEMGFKPMAVTFIGMLMLSYGIARIMSIANVSGLWWGAMLGLLVWLLFLAPLMLSQTLYQNQPVKLWWIDVSYRFIATMLTGVVLGVWS